MAKKEYEEYEEEEYEEEECEDEEEEEEEYSSPRMKMLCRRFNQVMKQLDKCEEGSSRARELNDEIERLSRSMANIERADADKAAKRESEVRATELEGTKRWDKAKTIMTVLGVMTPIGVEMIRQHSEMKKVDKTMGYENDGNIWNTGAKKFIK